LCVLIAAILAFFAILHAGRALMPVSQGGPPNPGVARGAIANLAQLLVALLTVVTTAFAFGRLFTKLGQPAVVGEIVAGTMLGPSLLRTLFPGPMGWLIPGTVEPALAALSQLGILLYMFLVGLETDVNALGDRRAPILISHVSIVLPMLPNRFAVAVPTQAPKALYVTGAVSASLRRPMRFGAATVRQASLDPEEAHVSPT
jgi:hypothetical protein